MKRLIKTNKIKRAIKKVAKQISEDYEGQTVTFVCCLTGAFMFFGELLQNLSSSIDARVVFVKLSSYADRKSAGELEFQYESRRVNADENVIVVDDIYDSGQTLSFLLNKYKNAKSIKSCILLEKKVPHLYQNKIDYLALTCADKFVVGFGLDCDEKHRTLPYIAEI